MFPKPKKSDRPGVRRRREIKRLDRKFQQDIPADAVCVVGGAARVGCFGQIVRHHCRRRRHIDARWDEKLSLDICIGHHGEGHTIGPKAFKAKYGIDFDEPA